MSKDSLYFVERLLLASVLAIPLTLAMAYVLSLSTHTASMNTMASTGYPLMIIVCLRFLFDFPILQKKITEIKSQCVPIVLAFPALGVFLLT